MRFGRIGYGAKIACCGAGLLVLAAGACPAGAQTGVPIEGAQASAARARVLRAIDDPHTGDRWLLISDAAHPAGPGRLVMATDFSGSAAAHQGRPLFAIHAGDKLVVEEHTATVEACWEAVALGSANAGDSVVVRLRIGGAVLHAVAIAPGRVEVRR